MSSAVDIGRAVSAIRTNNDGRAVLGVLATLLSEGYMVSEQISTSQGLRASAVSYLDTVNTYATGLYAALPANSEPIDFVISGQIGLAASQTNDALGDIEHAAGVSRWDVASSLRAAITSVLGDAGNVAGAGLGGIASGLVAGGVAFARGARLLLLVAAGVGLIYVFRAPLLRAVKGLR